MLSWGTKQYSCLNTTSPSTAFRNSLCKKQKFFGFYWDSDHVTKTPHPMAWETTTPHKHLSAETAGDDWDWCAVMVKGLAVLQLSGLPKWTVSRVGTPAATWSGWKLSVLPCSGQDLSYSFSQASHDFMVFCILVICKCVSHDQELSYQVKQIVKERGILDVKYLISCNCSYIFLPVEFKVKEQSRNNCHSPHFRVFCRSRTLCDSQSATLSCSELVVILPQMAVVINGT